MSVEALHDLLNGQGGEQAKHTSRLNSSIVLHTDRHDDAELSEADLWFAQLNGSP